MNVLHYKQNNDYLLDFINQSYKLSIKNATLIIK